MTTVGLVGGLGPESTIDYYRRILQRWEERHPGSSPSIVIDSLDVQVGIRLAANDHKGLETYLLGSLQRLVGAGVDFIAMTANTAHLVFDELAAQCAVPLVSIVETCAQEAQRGGYRRMLLLGTGFTMAAPFYPAVCGRHGIAIVTPSDAERKWVHAMYIGELLKGEFREETRQELVALIARIRDAEGIDGVILGGTELPLLLGAPRVADLPTLDTTALHVREIIRRLEGGAT